ncbi:uncharacterized protein LOC130737306 [Lotus japonicus]|uniref:uncharacterized protein LOC130737306 n=1 Tax=Lotus japonicus TaxID=34305 RepID=UPI00258FAFD9|nr:uncharacterized protein LOC130737306 [Lotus japonicus]
MWRGIHNALPIKENLHRKKLSVDPLCPVCKKSSETLEHTFLLCDWTKPVWFGSQLQWSPSPEKVTRFDTWLKDGFETFKKDPTTLQQNIALVCLILWSIWKGRSAKVFEDHSPSPIFTLNQALGLWHENHLYSNNQGLGSQYGHATVNATSRGDMKWRKPPRDCVKANVDAAWKKGSSRTGLACVIRDHNGEILLGSATITLAPSPLVAEGLALREAMLLMTNLDCKKACLESDSKTLIEACRGVKESGSLKTIVTDIKRLSFQFDECNFQWTKRQGNVVAHEVAKLIYDDMLPPLWSSNPPPMSKLHSNGTQTRPIHSLVITGSTNRSTLATNLLLYPIPPLRTSRAFFLGLDWSQRVVDDKCEVSLFVEHEVENIPSALVDFRSTSHDGNSIEVAPHKKVARATSTAETGVDS